MGHNGQIGHMGHMGQMRFIKVDMTYMNCMTSLPFEKSFRVFSRFTICRRQITSAFICIIEIDELCDLFDLKGISLCGFV